MRARWLVVGGLLFVASGLAACGDDDDMTDVCPPGTAAGQTFPCTCGEDGGMTGMQTCGTDGKATSACTCGDTDAGDGSGGSTTGTGGSGNTGNGSGGSGASGSGGKGGSGGGGSDDTDSGATPEKDGGMGTTEPLPMDGKQLAVCDTGIDCDMGFDCYNPAMGGPGFCTQPCEMAADCMDIAGAMYTCSMSTQLCVIVCEGMDDTSCPTGMKCLANAGFQGGGGQQQPAPTFRCEYPAEMAEMPEQAAAWNACTSPISDDCDMGLVCNGTGAAASGSGYCTQRCQNTGECTMMPSSGSIMPTCEGGMGGGMGMGGGGNRMCVLDCTESADGCPDGMSCVENQFFNTSRCEFD